MKTKRARLDADRTAKPRTFLVAHVCSSARFIVHNDEIESYELRDEPEETDGLMPDGHYRRH